MLPGMKMYKIECTKCDWSEHRVVRRGESLIKKILSALSQRCPECKSKVTKRQEPVIF